MKLKDCFITHEMGDLQIMVAAGDTDFNGMVRSNKTAAFIVDSLKEETTKEAIVDAMEAKYDAPRDVLERDLDTVLEKLRRIGALEA